MGNDAAKSVALDEAGGNHADDRHDKERHQNENEGKDQQPTRVVPSSLSFAFHPLFESTNARSSNETPETARVSGWARQASGDLEVVPALVHVGGFVHQRVPARDILDALQERAAVTNGPGLFHRHAV